MRGINYGAHGKVCQAVEYKILFVYKNEFLYVCSVYVSSVLDRTQLTW